MPTEPAVLALTMGEPAGIGPDIALEAWRAVRGGGGPAFMLIGCAETLKQRAELLGLDAPVSQVPEPGSAASMFPLALPVFELALPSPARPGRIDAVNAPAVIAMIERGVDLALAGEVAGLVTGPIQKDTLYQAGFTHQGHTDFLAHLARERGHPAEPVMMLSAKDLRTVPITVHVALKRVPELLSSDAIVAQTRVVHRDLTRYIGHPPRIAMTGLNPHAGENGAMGDEETTVMAPAIARLARENIAVAGPLPADTVFHDEARAKFDVIICMYHDQALIPVKTLGFHDGVNTTLGLPFIRTSPDHGTALTLAGTGKANPSSLIAALGAAETMARAAATP